jgi:hypothetical protein
VVGFWVYRFGLSVRNPIIGGRPGHAHWFVGICKIALSIKDYTARIIGSYHPSYVVRIFLLVCSS